MNKCMECRTSINYYHDVLGLNSGLSFYFFCPPISLILSLCSVSPVFASYHECIFLIKDVAKLQGHGVLSSSIFLSSSIRFFGFITSCFTL